MTGYLRHGAAAGGAAGGALAAVLALLGRPPIEEAVALERARAAGGGHDELFARGTQQLGGLAAAVLFGVLAGLIFSVVFAAVVRRSGSGRGRSGQDDRAARPPVWQLSMALAGAGFSAVALVPFLKYPPNPPAVGDPATITDRSVLYVVVLAWAVVSTALAWWAHRALAARGQPDHLRAPAAVALYVALVGTGLALLPGNPDAVDAPAQLVWRFRMASLAGSAVLWAVLGTVFGWLQLRAARPVRAVVAVSR